MYNCDMGTKYWNLYFIKKESTGRRRGAALGPPMPKLPETSQSQDFLTSLRGGREEEHLVGMVIKVAWDTPAIC